MEKFKELFENPTTVHIVHSFIVMIVSIVLYKIISRVVLKGEKETKLGKKLNNKSKTYLKMLHSILRYVFIIITVLIILQINGVNVSSMLAGVGIAGAIIGLAIQDALKDIIRGINILSDEYFSVGDVVEYQNIIGKVLVIGLKTTKIQDLATNNIVSIANRNIEQIQLVSHDIYVKAPLPYEVPVERGELVLQEIVEEIKKYPDVEDANYIGVTELADSSIQYLLKVECLPEKKLGVRRKTLEIILKVLERNHIAVPFNQLDIHQK